MQVHTLFTNEKYKNEHFIVIHEWEITSNDDEGYELVTVNHSLKKSSRVFNKLVKDAKKFVQDNPGWIVIDDLPNFFSSYNPINQSYETIRLLND